MEGKLQVPTEIMISELCKWLTAKYTIYVAYRSFSDRVKGPWRDALIEHWHEHSNEELKSAYDIAMKIVGLGGDPEVLDMIIPRTSNNIYDFCLCLVDLELEAINRARLVMGMSGTMDSLRVMAENMLLIDTQHLDDLRRMFNLQHSMDV